MNYLTADQVLMERLAGVMEPIEIRDPSGRVLGRYTPVFAKDQGSPLKEVWRRIRAGEIQG